VYDGFHQQFFVAVPGTDAVEVVSATNGAVLFKIGVPSPSWLDLSSDGSRLYVTSNASNFGSPSSEGFFVIDTVSFRIVDFVQPVVPVSALQVFFPNLLTSPRFIAAMNSGKIFYNADQTGTTGSQIFEYDPSTGVSTARPPTGGGNFYDGTIQKSVNGQRFVVLSSDTAGGDIWTYDSDTDSYLAHLRLNNMVVESAIFSPDATRVLVSGHLLFDENLNQIADLNPNGGYPSYRGSVFSPDSSTIYVLTNYTVTQTNSGGGTTTYSNPVIAVYQTSTGTLLGYIPAPVFAATPLSQGIAVSPQGFAIALNDRGFAEMNLSQLNATLPGATSQLLRYPNMVTPPVGSPASPSATVVNGAGFPSGVSVYFGANAALSANVASTNTINVVPPPGTAGAVDVSILFPDGWALYGPEAYSYGPVVLYQDVNAGDVNGNTTVNVIGYGFDTSNGQPTVTVGSASATVISVSLSLGISPFTFPIEHLTFTTPVGAPGFADITVSTPSGSTTVKNGFQYIAHTVISGIAPAQMVLDESRGFLYVADFASGDVKSINVSTNAVATLLASAANPVTGLAMSPDDSQLLIISASAGALTIFDLNAGTVVKTIYPVPLGQPTQLIPNSIVATARDTALVGLDDPSLLSSGDLYEVNLATGNVTPVAAGPCAVTSHIFFAPTSDGSQIYTAPDAAAGLSGGCITRWSAALDAVAEEKNYQGGISDLSATSLGDRFLAGISIYATSPGLSVTGVLAPNDLLALQRQQVVGEKIHSTGSLAYVPTTKAWRFTMLLMGRWRNR
jgi:hypothetical protein